MASSLVTGNLIKADGTQSGYGCTDAGLAVTDTGYECRGSLPAADPGGWLARFDADDLSGADESAVSTWGTDIAATQATGGNQPTLRTGANGINNRNAVQFGSNKYLQTATGGASLAGDWYAAAVCKRTGTGFQWVWCWGEEGTGQRRAFGNAVRSGGQVWELNGSSADLTTWVASGTAAVLVECQNVDGLISAWANGVQILDGLAAATTAYSSAAVTLGGNNGGTENWTGLIARMWFASGVPTAGQVQYVRETAATNYALTVGRAAASLAGGPITAGVATVTRLTATGGQKEHSLVTAFSNKNVQFVQNLAPDGYSATVYKPSTSTADAEIPSMAVGYGNLSEPAGVFRGAGFIEVTGGFIHRDIHTGAVGSVGSGNVRRFEERPTGEISLYRASAAWPSEPLACMTGLPDQAVANDGVAVLASTATENGVSVTRGLYTPLFGLLVVADVTGTKTGVFRVDGTTLTSVSADAEFSTTKDTSSKVNVYAESGAIRLQNKTGGSLNLTAAYYGA